MENPDGRNVIAVWGMHRPDVAGALREWARQGASVALMACQPSDAAVQALQDELETLGGISAVCVDSDLNRAIELFGRVDKVLAGEGEAEAARHACESLRRGERPEVMIVD